MGPSDGINDSLKYFEDREDGSGLMGSGYQTMGLSRIAGSKASQISITRTGIHPISRSRGIRTVGNFSKRKNLGIAKLKPADSMIEEEIFQWLVETRILG